MSDQRGYGAGQAVVLLVGLNMGVMPLLSKIFGWSPSVALPLRLPDPWWWIVSVLVLGVAVVLISKLEQAKKRAAAS